MGLKNKDKTATNQAADTEALSIADAAEAIDAKLPDATDTAGTIAADATDTDPRVLIEALPDGDTKTALLEAYDAKVVALNAARPAAAQPEIIRGKIAMTAPSDVTTISIGGEQYTANEDGHFMVFEHHIEAAITHGFAQVRDTLKSKE